MKQALALTDNQRHVLGQASPTQPIYAEDPAFSGAQMPNGGVAVSLRTVKSLEKHGLLKPDGRGGYLITEKAAQLLGR